MSVSYGFYDSANGDRQYNVEDISRMFDGLFSDGVFRNYGHAFMVSAGGGMTVSVDTGKAWFNHTWTLNDAPLLLSIEAADATLDRIDAIVLEVDSSRLVRENFIKVVTGTPADPPESPVLGQHQYPLAYILVTAGLTEITNACITNAIGTEPTPYLKDLINDMEYVIDSVIEQFKNRYKSVMLRTAYPIGSIYISLNSISPAVFIGGTWEMIPGRFLIGAGTWKDARNETKSFSAGAVGGAFNHTLTAREMTVHGHNGSTSSPTQHTHSFVDMYNLSRTGPANGSSDKALMNSNQTTNAAGNHNHVVKSVGSTGEGETHNNMPPYLVAYIWKRTA